MKEGDTFFFAVRPNGSVMVILTPKDSTVESQLMWLFGLGEEAADEFQVKEIIQTDSSPLNFAARYILDELGIEPQEPEVDELDKILEKYGKKFPNTFDFARLARESLKDISALDEADVVLMAWLEREELLFRRLERHIVTDRLKSGFLDNEIADVDGFIAFSLSVQNRRK
jgi:hypothetical protein